jgi:hypothetical protein
VPKLILNLKKFVKFRQFKILAIIILLIVIQLLVVFISSNAPFEQQLYGRTGRGLGFLTHISLLIIMLAAAVFAKKSDLKLIVTFLVISGLVTSVYSILQSFGIDFLKWDSRTNGVIGTLGNPNFQSSFAAMVLVPAIFAFWRNKYKDIPNFRFHLHADNLELAYPAAHEKLRSLRVELHKTASYHTSSNGLAERGIGVIDQKERTLRIARNMPECFREDAWNFAIHLTNIFPYRYKGE